VLRREKRAPKHRVCSIPFLVKGAIVVHSDGHQPMQHQRKSRFVVLGCLLALGMLLASFYNRDQEKGKPFIVVTVARAVFSPFQSAVHSVQGFGRGIKGSLRSRSGLQNENKSLQEEVKRLSTENAQLREEHSENLRLRSSLGFKKHYPARLCSAQVIARGASAWHRTCTVDRGWRDGVKRAAPVITPRGLVGQVLDAGPKQSLVLLLDDESSGIGAVVQRSRVAGVCQGQHNGFLIMNYIDKDADVKIGDLVVSSGMGGIYPRGLQIGRIVRIQHGDGLQKSAEIRPSVQVDQVEEAFIIVKGPGN
jgi:rod shape-determining protein MreC